MAERKETLPAVREEPSELAEWGSEALVHGMGERLRQTLPGGQLLTAQQAVSLAQVAALSDANPFRGEVYAYNDRGRFQIVEGYKLLVRWAKRQEPYSEIYRQMAADDEELPPNAIGFRCYILRASNQALLSSLLQGGLTVDQAMDVAATSAVGIVTQQDRLTKDGRPCPPPSGWTWEQVARKRALKTALNFAYGMPSPSETAQMRAEEGITDADWQEVPEGCGPDEAHALAEVNARERERKALVANLTDEEREARAEQFRETLHGKDEDSNWDAPKTEQQAPPAQTAQADKDTGHVERPLPPEEVKRVVGVKLDRARPAQKTGAASPGQRGLLAGKLEECWPGDPAAKEKRHSVMGYLIGKTSLSETTIAEASALLDWLLDGAADPGTFDLHPAAPQEAEAILRLTLVEAGQGELPL